MAGYHQVDHLVQERRSDLVRKPRVVVGRKPDEPALGIADAGCGRKPGRPLDPDLAALWNENPVVHDEIRPPVPVVERGQIVFPREPDPVRVRPRGLYFVFLHVPLAFVGKRRDAANADVGLKESARIRLLC